ncbi:MAG: DUF2591 domain-containing protein [Alteromonadales bacterium]|nr:DUF2591 domain-containing protein [Alteromonadales bacterium]
MNYNELSDFEINKLVAEKLTGKESIFVPDYCNNPSDAWPIIVDNRITVAPYDDASQGWSATYDTSFFIDDDNPLRAAMIVYLMMNKEA